MTEASMPGGTRTGKRLWEIVTVVMTAAALLILPVNFLLAIPVAVAGMITSAISLTQDQGNKRLYAAGLAINGVIFLAAVAMTLLLVQVGAPDEISVTIEPAS